jgi:hypothetical protein
MIFPTAGLSESLCTEKTLWSTTTKCRDNRRWSGRTH